MSVLDSLAKPPFNLDAAAIAWVRDTLARLSEDEKIRQLFNLRIGRGDPSELAALQKFRPGGITTHSPEKDNDGRGRMIDDFNAKAPVPVIVSADLEGSRMSLPGGTELPNPLALAALDDVEVTREAARIMAAEAVAAGINWTFTPVLDINAAFRSAIVATRGFGADVATIERHAIATMEEFQKQGIASAVKHWPGEGYDDRDQHLVTTINPLSMAEWEKTFGRLYRAAIDAGALSVMSGHIALPAFVRELDPAAGIEAHRPASISRLLNEELLRKRLGFNGLIVSDATQMAGLSSWATRSEGLPDVVANGCDVILFTADPETDYGYIKAAVDDGRITRPRLDEAVTRILALKAAVGLHKPRARRETVIGSRESRAFADAITKRIPTLVKDTQNLLPLSPETHKRILVLTPDIIDPWVPHPIPFAVPELLRDHGFEVTVHAPNAPIDPDAVDLVLLLFGEETLMTRARIGLDWAKLMGNPMLAMQRTWHDVPTMMISFGYPYMLYDAPRMPTYINAYMTTETMQRAVVELLLGNGTWNRNNPVDPFCGLEDARY
jgi:beta-N-acetylhexosaminidase